MSFKHDDGVILRKRTRKTNEEKQYLANYKGRKTDNFVLYSSHQATWKSAPFEEAIH